MSYLSVNVYFLTILSLYYNIYMLSEKPDVFMKNDKLLSALNEFGLTDNEAKMYLSALSLGETTVLKLVKDTEIKRTTAYEVITSLIQKGLMRKEIKGFKTLYVVEHPDRLKNTLEIKNNILSRIIPELEGLYNLKGTQGAVKYYEGLQSIRNVYNELLKEVKPHDFCYIISNVTDWYDIQGEEFINDHVEIRATLRLDTKILLLDSPIAQMRKKTERNFNEEIKILPKDNIFNVDLVITPYRLIMFQLKSPLVAIVIENTSLIEIQKVMFEIIWKSIV